MESPGFIPYFKSDWLQLGVGATLHGARTTEISHCKIRTSKLGDGACTPREQSIRIELRRTVVRVLTISAGSSIVSKVLRRTDPLRVDDCSMSPTEGGSTLPGCSVFSGSTPSWRNQSNTTSGTVEMYS